MSVTTGTRPVDRVLAQLEGVRGHHPQWEALCPAHPDRSPSLAVSEGEDGRALIHCHAGCSTADVLAAVGLADRDLFADESAQERSRRPREVARYTYTDESRTPLYAVVRTEPKGFYQVPANGRRGAGSMNGVRRVLYRLPEVLAAVADGQPVWIVEGEKDADALARAGEVATCNPQGAGKWAAVADAADVLEGATVLVWVDDDEPGHRHGRDVVRSIDGRAEGWIVFRSPHAKDAAEHLGAGRPLTDLEELASSDGDRTWLDGPGDAGPDQPTGDDDAEGWAGGSIVDRYRASLVDWSELWERDPNASDWLVEPILPRGRGIATYSPAKAGKSLLSLDVAARVASGRRCLDQAASEPLSVLYVDAEMTADDLRERLEDMGYGADDDLSRLHYHVLPDLPPLDTPAGGAELSELAAAYGAELVVLDTVAAVVAGNENDADTYRAYWNCTGKRLKAAGRTVWRLDHAGKDPTKGQRGSSAKAGDVDLVWEMQAREGSAVQLRATHRRIGWVPERVDLVRLEDPLRHERATGSWPAGTAEVAVVLDRLGVPLDASRRDAMAALKDADEGRRAVVVNAALRWRRQQEQAV